MFLKLLMLLLYNSYNRKFFKGFVWGFCMSIPRMGFHVGREEDESEQELSSEVRELSERYSLVEPQNDQFSEVRGEYGSMKIPGVGTEMGRYVGINDKGLTLIDNVLRINYNQRVGPDGQIVQSVRDARIQAEPDFYSSGIIGFQKMTREELENMRDQINGSIPGQRDSEDISDYSI